MSTNYCYNLFIKKQQDEVLEEYITSIHKLIDCLDNCITDHSSQHFVYVTYDTQIDKNTITTFIKKLKKELSRKNFTGFPDVVPELKSLSNVNEYNHWQTVIDKILAEI